MIVIVWTRKQYTEYVCVYLSDAKNVEAFFSCFRAEEGVPAQPRAPTSNPNDQP